MPADSNSPAISVVCAIIERDHHVLIAQRPPGKHLAGKWEFPGGKIDPGETPENALLREIREELACRLIITRRLPPNIHHYETTSIELIPFVCRLAIDSPPPVSHEHTNLIWVTPQEILQHDLAPADLPVVSSYLASFHTS